MVCIGLQKLKKEYKMEYDILSMFCIVNGDITAYVYGLPLLH